MTHKNNPTKSKSEEAEQQTAECADIKAQSNPPTDEVQPRMKIIEEWLAGLEERREQEERSNACSAEFYRLREYEKQIAFFHQILDDGLMDSNNAFEMLNELYSKAVHDQGGNQERDRIDSMIIKLRKLEPEAYADRAYSFLDWQITNALATGRLDALPDLTQEAVTIATQHLWIFNDLIHLLAYHNQLPTLVEMTRAAFCELQKTEPKKQSYKEFIRLAIDAEVLTYLEHHPVPASIPAALRERLEPFNSGNHVNWPRLEQDIAYLTGRKMDDYTKMQSVAEDFHKLNTLFMQYLHQQEDIPYSKAYLARLGIYQYLLNRDAGDLEIPLLHLSRFKGSWPEPPKWEHYLIPDHYSLFAYFYEIAEDNISGTYYQTAATFEMVPAWLRFLKSLNLIDTSLLQEVCSNLQGLDDKVLDIWNGSPEAAFPEATKRWSDDLRAICGKIEI